MAIIYLPQREGVGAALGRAFTTFALQYDKRQREERARQARLEELKTLFGLKEGLQEKGFEHEESMQASEQEYDWKKFIAESDFRKDLQQSGFDFDLKKLDKAFDLRVKELEKTQKLDEKTARLKASLEANTQMGILQERFRQAQALTGIEHDNAMTKLKSEYGLMGELAEKKGEIQKDLTADKYRHEDTLQTKLTKLRTDAQAKQAKLDRKLAKELATTKNAEAMRRLRVEYQEKKQIARKHNATLMAVERSKATAKTDKELKDLANKFDTAIQEAIKLEAELEEVGVVALTQEIFRPVFEALGQPMPKIIQGEKKGWIFKDYVPPTALQSKGGGSTIPSAPSGNLKKITP